MKNNQYPKDLISESDIMKNHRHNDSAMINAENKT